MLFTGTPFAYTSSKRVAAQNVSGTVRSRPISRKFEAVARRPRFNAVCSGHSGLIGFYPLTKCQRQAPSTSSTRVSTGRWSEPRSGPRSLLSRRQWAEASTWSMGMPTRPSPALGQVGPRPLARCQPRASRPAKALDQGLALRSPASRAGVGAAGLDQLFQQPVAARLVFRQQRRHGVEGGHAQGAAGEFQLRPQVDDALVVAALVALFQRQAGEQGDTEGRVLGMHQPVRIAGQLFQFPGVARRDFQQHHQVRSGLFQPGGQRRQVGAVQVQVGAGHAQLRAFPAT